MPKVVFHTNLDEPKHDVHTLNEAWPIDSVPRVGERIEFDFGKKSYELEVCAVRYVCNLHTNTAVPYIPHIRVELHIPKNQGTYMTLGEWEKWYTRHILERA